MPDPMMDPATDQQNAPAAPQAAAPQPPPPPDMEAAPEPVKPDGGVLGHAVIGALTNATKPPDMEAAPPPMESADTGNSTSTPPEHSWWDTAKKVLTFNPILTPLNAAAEATSNKAAETVQNRDMANLSAASHGMQSPYSTIGTLAIRGAKDLAGDVEGLSSPEGAALGAAAATGPIGASAVGLYTVGHGLYDVHGSWGSLANPDVLQNELNAAAETVGGAASLTEGAKGITQAWKNKTANTPDLQYQHFKNAVPPTKTAPYTEMDYQAARPYLDAEHTTGTPISGISSTVDAADSAIEKIEGKVDTVIKANPDTLVHVNPIDAAYQALKGSVRTDFLDAGMKELEKYPMGFERSGPTIEKGVQDEPLTLQRADDIRRQLNDENRSIMKSKNNYDIANMMNTDPAFAARQAAAEALRTGIYDTLEHLGLKDARLIRLDEGSLIKIRNAAERQRFNAEKAVKPTSKPSLLKRAAKKASVGIGAAAGFEMGAKVGHPLIGSSIGAEMGSEAANALAPKALTRDELIQKAFEPIVKPQPINGQYPLTGIPTQAANTPGIVAGQAPPAGYVHVRGSDGSEHYIPEAQINNIHEHDPGAQILNPQQ